jgi:ribosomal protein S6--L-glutamate ligase
VRIGLIADWLNPCILAAIDMLEQMGATVDVAYPDRELIRLDQVAVQHDLYVLKSGTEAALSLGGLLHALGAATLNPYPVVVGLRNKVLVTHALQAAGVPVPETYLTCNPDHVSPLLVNGPLILKPQRGSRGEGIHIIREPAQLAAVALDGPTVVQRYHEPDGPDRKLYRIGGRIFGVLRRWPLRTYADKIGEPFEPDAELSDLAFRCGEVFGIDLYGLDVVISQGRPAVVDLNKFGSFMGVPDAPRRLAEHLLQAARRPRRLAWSASSRELELGVL